MLTNERRARSEAYRGAATARLFEVRSARIWSSRSDKAESVFTRTAPQAIRTRYAGEEP